MRVMAVDYGDARTGVAISDMLGIIAGETLVIEEADEQRLAGKLSDLAARKGVGLLVLGHPINMNGSSGPRAVKSENFAQLLKQASGLPVVLLDERRTTVEAHSILATAGQNAKKRKKSVDAVAAALILETYLGQQNR
ncbi:MAG: Holliday junction resolvase RuvX [Clostridiales bacterium]|nr:Holliday junction resolvase RuvX [Clostridiales bacterium]